jgi:hypothetical protein
MTPNRGCRKTPGGVDWFASRGSSDPWVEAQRKPLLAARLLTLFGRWQRQGEGDNVVMHLVVIKAIDHSELLQGLVSRSRDFR